MSTKKLVKDPCAPVPVCQDQAPKCCPDPCAPPPCQDPCQDPCAVTQGVSGKGFSGQGGYSGHGYGYGGGKK
ncbi:hypothetical protein GDO78_022103 [Eleutherodactylus coqui]|uniref:Uncharacterized protein n=1 Tax=Eleutherodactylus coqui TaxID=57060 RepID=A0A8J6EGE7_ELECQ|nr:hypothetical protein GDO78_022103 [Eleutherodactylus coqui]